VLKVPDAVGDRVRDVAKRAAKDLAQHEITLRLDHGLYRAWRCRRPRDWAYGFDVHTGPGWLMVTGDMGTCMWERTTDMVSWVRGSINSLSYFAEKVPREFKIKEYDPAMAKAWLLWEIVGYYNDHCGCDMRKQDWDRWQALLDLYRESDPDDQLGFEREVYESGIADGSDWPNFKNYCYHFLWIREGLKWFLANLDKAVPEPRPGLLQVCGRWLEEANRYDGPTGRDYKPEPATTW
jgi:hypothetical protein